MVVYEELEFYYPCTPGIFVFAVPAIKSSFRLLTHLETILGLFKIYKLILSL